MVGVARDAMGWSVSLVGLREEKVVLGDVRRRVREPLLGASSGRDRDRSWRGEHRPRGPGLRPPSRRHSTYHKGGDAFIATHNAERTKKTGTTIRNDN